MTEIKEIKSFIEKSLGDKWFIKNFDLSLLNSNNGNNNRLYKLLGPNNSSYVIKKYYNSHLSFNRINAEYNALVFLKKYGINNVPVPVAKDNIANCVMYKWIEGFKVSKIGDFEINSAISFMNQLKEASVSKDANSITLAKEACISANEICRQIVYRYRLLKDSSAFNYELAKYLRIDVDNILFPIIKKAKEQFYNNGLSFDKPLSKKYQTLSPSDFGYHNAIKTIDGNIKFLDFEYFGWDDPVKLISDFLLHPGMNYLNFSFQMWKKFYSNSVKVFSYDPNFIVRLNILFPLFILRWSLIVLNEFIPLNWERRKFSGQSDSKEKILKIQLQKSKKFIQQAHLSLEKDMFNIDDENYLDNFYRFS
ncbi:hypothetical protein OAK17_06295 [Alphaproteobacteria bacterium]|nr:hypothetical protein [Alphaproteobacteria bacterium]